MSGPMRSFIERKNSIGSVVIEILSYTQQLFFYGGDNELLISNIFTNSPTNYFIL